LVVLVVDDDQDAAESMREVLISHGYDALAAFDGAAALELAGKVRPKVVIADLVMADVDGLEMCRRLRLEAWASTVLMIAVSGWAHKIEEALRVGFDEFFLKPVEIEALRPFLESRRLPLC
jgi:two-component system KDP operon response regulator KdpE